MGQQTHSSTAPRLRIGLVVLGVSALALTACADDADPAADDPLQWGRAYVEDPRLGREALVESLRAPERGYGALRLANYGPGRPWAQFPAVDRPVRAVTRADVGPEAPAWNLTEGAFEPLGALSDWSHDGVVDYGRRAFASYPLGADGTYRAGLDDAGDPARFGLWTAPDGRVGGLVRVRIDDDSEAYAPTCSTCHSSTNGDAGDGALVPGRPNADFDYDAMALHELSGRATYPVSRWGAGSVDVTPDAVMNPAGMADLRAVSHQRNLHWAATLENSLPALTVRIETLIITSLGDARPPREVAFAMAYYLWSLGEEGRVPTDGRGARLFEQNCSSCHGADGSAGPAVSVDVVGTDPAVATSSTRGVGTGVYRVPSLWRVGDRGQFLHDGSVGSLEDLLDPDRLATTSGHSFGTALTSAERADLIAFVRQIGALD